MTKVKMIIGTAVAFTVLAVAANFGEFLFRMPAAQQNGRDEETLTLVVKFSPERRPRDDRVFLEVFVDAKRIIDELVSDSWVRVVQVPKGRLVTLQATQETGKDLHCYIQDDGHALAEDHRLGPGDIICNYRYVIRP